MSQENIQIEKKEEDIQVYANKCGVFLIIGDTLYTGFGKIGADKISKINAEPVQPNFRIVIFNYTDIEIEVEPQFKHYFHFTIEITENGHFVLDMTSPYACDGTWGVSYRLPPKTAYKLLQYVFRHAVSIEKAKD